MDGQAVARIRNGRFHDADGLAVHLLASECGKILGARRWTARLAEDKQWVGVRPCCLTVHPAALDEEKVAVPQDGRSGYAQEMSLKWLLRE